MTDLSDAEKLRKLADWFASASDGALLIREAPLCATTAADLRRIAGRLDVIDTMTGRVILDTCPACGICGDLEGHQCKKQAVENSDE